MSLIRRIELHMRAQRQAPTRFGREAINDPRLVSDLRRGRLPGTRTVERVDAYIMSCREAGR